MSLRLFIFSIILFLFQCPYQHGKVDWLALCKCFILLKTNIAKQGGTKLNYKVRISGKQGPYSAVKQWLNIFFFFKFAGNIAVRPLISETMNYFFAFSQLPVDIFRQHFCTTQLLKVNFQFRSFLSSISPYRANHSLKP